LRRVETMEKKYGWVEMWFTKSGTLYMHCNVDVGGMAMMGAVLSRESIKDVRRRRKPRN